MINKELNEGTETDVRPAPQPAELDTQAYEALHYRARLILGDSLPRLHRPSSLAHVANEGENF